MTKLKLYWASTPDHDEDWFVVAHSPEQAAQWFEGAEGYAEGDAEAEYVAEMPERLPEGTTPEVGWPSRDLIAACGGEFVPYTAAGGKAAEAIRGLMGSGTRLVRFGERVFSEGDLVGTIFQEGGRIEDDS